MLKKGGIVDRTEIKRKAVEFLLGKSRLHMKDMYNAGIGMTVKIESLTLDEMEAEVENALDNMECGLFTVVSMFKIGDFEQKFIDNMSRVEFSDSLVESKHPEGIHEIIYLEGNEK